jgi:hypothetical protein
MFFYASECADNIIVYNLKTCSFCHLSILYKSI